MDLMTLNMTTFLPEKLIENYTSLIWTERYMTAGEFELRTPRIAETMELLPEGQFVSLRDSLEVMMVETHVIDVDEDGNHVLTVSGRTFETFLENRVMLGFLRDPWDTLQPYSSAGVSCLVSWNGLVNATGHEPTRTGQLKNTHDAIPGIVVTDSTTHAETPKIWTLEVGQVYEKLLGFLELGDLGIRMIRPTNQTANVVTFNVSTTEARGTIQETVTNNIQQLRLDIYKGLDRTRNNGVREPVLFHYNSGHVETPQYLFSIKGTKNMVRVITSFRWLNVYANGTEPPDPVPTGMNLRVLHMDGGEPGDEGQEFLPLAIQKAQLELKKFNRSVIFDGAISLLSPYKYNEQYRLGDIVTLAAEYGFEASMLVAEYVRTEDETGDRGYPTLTIQLPD